MIEYNGEPVTMEMLRNWKEIDHDTLDLIFIYFNETSKAEDWIEVSHEGRKIFNAMFDEDVEDSSPMDNVFSGIAGEAYQGTVRAMARMFGLPEKEVGYVLDGWYDKEPGKNFPSPITGLEFEKRVREEQADSEARKLKAMESK